MRRRPSQATVAEGSSPVVWYDELTEEERREIELEENLQRKDLTAYERSKTVQQLAETAKEIEARAEEVLPDSGKTPKGGRPSKGSASQGSASRRTGLPQQTISDAERHVEVLDPAARRVMAALCPRRDRCRTLDEAARVVGLSPSHVNRIRTRALRRLRRGA